MYCVLKVHSGGISGMITVCQGFAAVTQMYIQLSRLTDLLYQEG